ncbi:MAG: alpha/beta hydrolase family protein [Ktedonobacterales bacterium]
MSSPFSARHAVAEVEQLIIGPRDIPALLVRPVSPGPHPGAILQHGYGASKSDVLPLAHSLASYGFVVLLPDAWGHGERFPAEGPNWMTEISVDYFVQVVRETVDDLRESVGILAARPEVRADALLMGGFSMGAVTALVAGFEDARVSGVVSMAGSPLPDLMHVTIFNARPPSDESRQWAANHDVVSQLSQFAPKPLLISHGRNDDMVPFAGALRLYETAKPLYASHPDRLALMEYNHTHTVSEAQVHDAVAWIAPFFASAGTHAPDDETNLRESAV